MCGVWVALEAVRDDNGPLHYYPVSHKLPFYDLIDMGLKGSDAQTAAEVYGVTYRQYEDKLSQIVAAHGLKKEVLNMPKGRYFDETIKQANEGYAKRITMPASVRRLGRFIPKPLLKLLKR